jgi:predicted DCC family thiol-disulfide oxidoreductase YuxK
VVIFDGLCNLCNRSVQFILDHDRRRRLLLCASQSQAGQRLLARHPTADSADDSIRLADGDRLYSRSTAVLRIGRALGFPWSLAWLFVLVPRPLRDPVYDFVARHRYRWFGRRETCRLARPGELERFLT